MSKKPPNAERLFDLLAAHIKPVSELNYRSNLDLLIAVVLSAQTTDVAVNKVTAELWKQCRSPQDYLELGEARLQEFCRSIGLFRNKTRSILGLCQMLLERFDGQVPSSREELMSLPGVGRKTANVLLNVAFKQPVIAVDTHVFRVSNRSGLAQGKTPEQVEQQLMDVIPKKHLLHAHHYLILHGRYCCTARQPKCESCVIRQECRYENKNLPKKT